MSNPANNGTLIGRLSQDVKAFANQDGSQKLMISIAVEDNFKSGPEQKAQTSFVQVEAFVGAGKSAGGWDRVHKGDLIAVQFRVDARSYTGKDGKTVYPVKLVVEGFPTFLEPKSVTDKRLAQGAVTARERIAALEAEKAQLQAGAAGPAQPAADYQNTDPFGN